MDVIAELAQVAKGTLYYHFKTKDELFYYVNKKGVGMLVDRITEVMQDSTRTIRERLLSVLDEHIRFFSEEQELCLLLLNFTTGNQQRDEIIRALLGDYFVTNEKFLKALQDEGHISRELEIRTLASAMFGMIGITVMRNRYQWEPQSLEEMRDSLVILCKGMLHLH